jgi:hypothetical protein
VIKAAIDLPAAVFGTVAEEAISIASGRALRLPASLASNRRGDVSLTARFARLPAGGELRSVHIHGARIEIINLFHFPAPDRATPVYAMEFVVFGRRPVVGVIDAKPLARHPAAERMWRDALEKAHTLFPCLVRADDPPPWYDECRSGLDFFTRPEHFNGLGELLACHAHVWARLAAGDSGASQLDAAETAAHALMIADYKKHHRENSPGLPFLNRTFGAEWTDDFLRNALFA